MDTIALLQYPGSKARLAEVIISMIPPHNTYVEAFGGSAAVLLAKEPSPIEVYNDISGDIVTLFRVVRDAIRRENLSQLLTWTPYSREELTNAAKLLAHRRVLDDIEHARLVFTVYNQSISGMVRNGKAPWSYTITGTSQADEFRRRMAALDVIGRRLASVQIECKHFTEVFELYDGPETFWYLDPPYLLDTRSVDLYQHEMYAHEHREMVNRIMQMQGQFVLSGYDTPIYAPLEEAGWQRVEVETFASMGVEKGPHPERTEVLWTNIGRMPAKSSKRRTKGQQISADQLQMFS